MTETIKPLLVGEANPYGADPRFALYPLPEHSSGGRLCRKVMGLEPRQYFRKFDRMNLCPGKWSAPISRASAARILDGGSEVTVLLGAKVTRAFGFEFDPFNVMLLGVRHFVILPHPSGLCRIWNEPEAYKRARATLSAAGVVLE